MPNQIPQNHFNLKNHVKYPNLKTIVISFCVLAVLCLGFFYYSSGIGNELSAAPKKEGKTKIIESELKENDKEKEMILQDLRDLKKTYDEIIIDNKNMSLELIQERVKVMKLLADISMSQNNRAALEDFKKQATLLRDKLNRLAIENKILKIENKEIKKERDSAKVGLKVAQNNNEGLQRDLVKTVEKFSKLDVSNTTVVSFKLRGSGELIVTDKANKVEGVNISFIIAKNEIARPADKIFYIQIMNSKNVVVGDDNMRTHQYKSLTYSVATNVKYENKMLRVSENIMGKNFAKGTYYVNIFDGEELVDESSFILK
jgi:hypothetical protein